MRRVGPGRARLKLAEMLAKRLHTDGREVRLDPSLLWPARGYWRTNIEADVYRWEGQFEIWRHEKWNKISIVSWSCMSDCIRGFDYAFATAYRVEVFAISDRTHPASLRMRDKIARGANP
jgi:hypothetical protein